ncbi:triosephosphate isomerase [Lates japonicus]|uniref:Triosephosphate isomerase n=1 Tax=Lates japonicus TaxID=270547 RepID=A0AAD3NL73_LATJO|nr:triosephosphate isomerase [Lates japonicus]
MHTDERRLEGGARLAGCETGCQRWCVLLPLHLPDHWVQSRPQDRCRSPELLQRAKELLIGEIRLVVLGHSERSAMVFGESDELIGQKAQEVHEKLRSWLRANALGDDVRNFSVIIYGVFSNGIISQRADAQADVIGFCRQSSLETRVCPHHQRTQARNRRSSDGTNQNTL